MQSNRCHRLVLNKMLKNEVKFVCKTITYLVIFTSIVTTTAALATNANAAADSHSSSAEFIPDPVELTYCDETMERTIGRRLLYITTLDGRLTALDMTKSGRMRWSIPTGPGPLVSSSIHRLELTNNGQFVRMIPSLNGGIYKFDGESIDPIPITTENLLSSSAKFSDDLVISGGKETRTYGVSARTGKLLYKCSMHGCINTTDDADEASRVPEAVNSNSNTKDEIIDSIENGDNDAAASTSDGYLRDKDGYIVEHNPQLDDVIVIRRQTQTVRAVESRTGLERWNFSVGQHEIDLLRASECHERIYTELDLAVLDVDIKVVVPEGLIFAYSKSDPHMLLWKYKFDHPIVSAWKIDGDDNIEAIDLFDSAQWLWQQYEGSSSKTMDNVPCSSVNPSIYLGMYEKQLYIQESISLRQELFDGSGKLYSQLTAGSEAILPKIPWRPFAARSNALMVFHNNKLGNGDSRTSSSSSTFPTNEDSTNSGQELMPYDDEQHHDLTAQSILNASEYVNGNGFYLYTNGDWKKRLKDTTCETTTTSTTTTKHLPAIEDASKPAVDETEKVTAATNTEIIGNETGATNNRSINDDMGFSLDDIDAPVKVVILSLWFWWKEIVVIAFTSAVLMNMFLGQRQRAEREIVVIERHVPVATAIEATEASTQALLGPVNGMLNKFGNHHNAPRRSISESTTHSGEHFTSRFQTDFDLLQCLGRGGFGVVFEAKNKLDENRYAVKRITLPNKEQSRQRVLREARTLASCEHHNIVRYFHCWVETPPMGWQEEEDSKLLALNESAVTSIQIETPDGSTMPSLADSLARFNKNRLKKYQNDKKTQSSLSSWMSDIASSTIDSFDHAATTTDNNGLSEIREDDIDDEDDSLVVFRTESQSAELRERGDNVDDNDNDEEDNNGNNSRNTKNDKNKCERLDDAVSIDIHSASFDMKKINYSQLSNSFQIEFVQPTCMDDDDGCAGGGGGGDYNDDNVFKKDDGNDGNGKTKQNNKRQQLSLALTTNNQNNNPTTSSSTTNKPTKVYLYIQMQLCRKESLRHWLRDNRTEVREQHIGHIFHQIVDAVEYVHLKGLIHRDLKPSNIFFSQDGQVKIGDFGLVTDVSDIPKSNTTAVEKIGTLHTQQVGTTLYMSPEQLSGKHYDYKVDIYSLGLIFFELHVYFVTEMERMKTMRDLRDGKYPKHFPSKYPAEYELLQKMLSTDPTQRPQTRELKQQIHKILHLPDYIEDGRTEAAAREAAARRLSRSRTFSSSE